MQGEVVWFKNTYGFIRAVTTGDEYFIHESAISDMPGYRTLKPSQKVNFEVELGPKGRPQAVNVRVVK